MAKVSGTTCTKGVFGQLLSCQLLTISHWGHDCQRLRTACHPIPGPHQSRRLRQAGDTCSLLVSSCFYCSHETCPRMIARSNLAILGAGAALRCQHVSTIGRHGETRHRVTQRLESNRRFAFSTFSSFTAACVSENTAAAGGRAARAEAAACRVFSTKMALITCSTLCWTGKNERISRNYDEMPTK